ncbi:hypothetical protein DICPUDRAFT_91707, partial [Dictyostelium purpureum]
MISMAPTPLYLPAEEANRVIRSPIFQRRDTKYNKDNSKEQPKEKSEQQDAEQKPKSNKSLKRSGSTWLSSQIDKRQIELMELSGKRLSGSTPKKCQDGVGGGVYFIQGEKDTHPTSVFKPIDEENGLIGPNHSIVGMKAGTLPGEGVFKEVAVYLFDQMNNGFFGVPVTTLVEVQHPIWNNKNGASSSESIDEIVDECSKESLMVKKIGSLQEYIVYEDTADEVGCSKFSVQDIHRIGLLDSLVLNCDRHSGNLLVVAKEDGAGPLELVPIDHSLCLPSSDQLSDAWFDWINFPQSKIPFSNEAKQMIQSIDIDQVINSLHAKLPKLRTECLETLKLTTLFVKKAVESGLNLNQIGTLISRYQSLDEPSPFEQLVANTQKKSPQKKLKKIKKYHKKNKN